VYDIWRFYKSVNIPYLHNLTDDLHLAGLTNYGFEEKDIELICSKTEVKNNPVVLTPANLRKIVTSA
jgi:hypothetical protein